MTLKLQSKHCIHKYDLDQLGQWALNNPMNYQDACDVAIRINVWMWKWPLSGPSRIGSTQPAVSLLDGVCIKFLVYCFTCPFSFWLKTLEEEKERKSECLPPEPPADDPESVKIVFKLPNDTRVERRFLFGQSLTVSATVKTPPPQHTRLTDDDYLISWYSGDLTMISSELVQIHFSLACDLHSQEKGGSCKYVCFIQTCSTREHIYSFLLASYVALTWSKKHFFSIFRCMWLFARLFFSFLSQVIYDFLFSLKESPEKFQIITNFPRRVLPCLPTEEQPNPPTLKEAGLSRSEVLFVQDLTED